MQYKKWLIVRDFKAQMTSGVVGLYSSLNGLNMSLHFEIFPGHDFRINIKVNIPFPRRAQCE